MAASDASGVSVRQEFVAISCNRTAGCADWSLGAFASTSRTAVPACGLLAFGAGNFVCLYDPAVRWV